jgi:hypothetical protein
MTPNTLVYNKIYSGIWHSPACSHTCSFEAYKISSRRASSPWLEPGETTASGRPWPFEQFFRVKAAQKQIEPARPPARSVVRVGRLPRKSTGSRPRLTLPAACSVPLRYTAQPAPLRTIALRSAIILAAGRVSRRLRRPTRCGARHLPALWRAPPDSWPYPTTFDF